MMNCEKRTKLLRQYEALKAEREKKLDAISEDDTISNEEYDAMANSILPSTRQRWIRSGWKRTRLHIRFVAAGLRMYSRHRSGYARTKSFLPSKPMYSKSTAHQMRTRGGPAKPSAGLTTNL